MKNYLFLILFLSLGIVQSAKAQSCDEMLKAAKAEEAKGEYFRAYQKYEAALNNCGEGRKDEIKKLKDKAILALQNLKNETEKQKKIADENLKKAEKLVNAFYFAYDRFALAYGGGEYDKKFYFIDKNGDKVEKLGEWDEAEKFEQEGSGFAKIWKGYETYYLDTFGISYKVVFNIKDLDRNVKALNLRLRYPNASNLIDIVSVMDITVLDSIPFFNDILTQTQLEILILTNGKIGKLPNSISRLQNLKTLHLKFNFINNLPSQIGELRNLRILNLSMNLLENLPYQIIMLKNLSYLDLSSNQLKRLQDQICELKNLQFLDLSFNQLNSLPIHIGELKNLKHLRLKNNPIPKEEQEKIRKLLPNCEVRF